jgi:hypothetical protein
MYCGDRNTWVVVHNHRAGVLSWPGGSVDWLGRAGLREGGHVGAGVL